MPEHVTGIPERRGNLYSLGALKATRAPPSWSAQARRATRAHPSWRAQARRRTRKNKKKETRDVGTTPPGGHRPGQETQDPLAGRKTHRHKGRHTRKKDTPEGTSHFPHTFLFCSVLGSAPSPLLGSRLLYVRSVRRSVTYAASDT